MPAAVYDTNKAEHLPGIGCLASLLITIAGLVFAGRIGAGTASSEGTSRMWSLRGPRVDTRAAGWRVGLGFAQLLDGELRGDDCGLGQQSGCGGLVCRDREGVAAPDGRAVAPCCPGQV